MKASAILLPVLAACPFAVANAQTDLTPEIIDPAPGSAVIISSISDNGKWGVCEHGSTTDGDIRPSGGVLINLETLEQISVSDPSGLSGVGDVTDDGSLIVGEAKGLPAYWSASTGKWTVLPLPAGYSSGHLNAVTPDGRIAVGYVSLVNDPYTSYPVAYDLSTNSNIDLTGLPTRDMTNLDQKQNNFYNVSADGRYVTGELSMSYISPASLCCYVYDLQEKTYKMIGFKENFYGNWLPKVDGLYFVDVPCISSNGKYVTGFAYMAKAVAGSEWANEYYSAFRYDVEADEITVYDDQDYAGFTVGNDGTVYASSPAQNPYSYMSVRSGDYFIGLDQILKQVYNVDFEAITGFSNTGKPVAVSADGKTFVLIVSTSQSFILRLKEPLSEAAKKINLLANYEVSPAPGAALSSITSFTITFDRNVATKGSYNKITFKGEDGSSWTPLSSNGFVADGKTVKVNFRTRELEAGKKYTLTIPAGMITIAGDGNIVSNEIKVEYTGRANVPVAVTEVYPADNSAVAMLDLTTNPMLITFDSEVRLADGAKAMLYREGESQPMCDLYVMASKNQILCYPISAQRLFSGTNYKAVIPAGTVTDISGNGANEEIVLNYRGNYVREISSSDRYIFSDDCTNYDNFIYYEGDHNTPASTPASWGFTADASPWYIVAGSSESKDMAMASHSMYTPAGQSDDWMSTPQLFIPDADCYLAFDAQSYLFGMEDRLKVYVYASNIVYNTFDAEIVNKIRTEGELVFNEVLDPGASQEGLDGEWTNYVVRLDKYAGKDVYIAFVNDNRAQSAVFVDNVQVVHDLRYLTTFENASRVVDQDEIKVKGTLMIASELETFTSLKMELKDADGKVLDVITDNGVNLVKNDLYHFEFKTPLALKLGYDNKFTVDVTLNDRKTVVNSSVKNLAFEPQKKVVIEEFSGRDCGNCPQGYVAMDYIRSVYGKSVIAMVCRTYQGDPLGTGLSAYSSFLGLESVGAPSARVNRGTPAYPMINTADGYKLSGEGILNELTGKDETLWFDLVRAEMDIPAEMAVNFSSAYKESSNTVDVEFEVKSALNTVDNNVNIFAVIIENGVDAGYQSNYFSSIESPILGEWGKGGAYASSYVIPFYADDVVRSTWGTTYNGTGGLIPADLTANESYTGSFSVPVPSTVSNLDNCEVVVVMVDAVTGLVINANIAGVNESTDNTQGGVGSVDADGSVDASVVAGEVVVTSSSEAVAEVYNVAGTLIAAGNGNGVFSLPLNGYTGFAIVRVVCADGAVLTKKVAVK